MGGFMINDGTHTHDLRYQRAQSAVFEIEKMK